MTETKKLIAVGDGSIWVEETNEYLPLSDLPGLIMSDKYGPGFIVGSKVTLYLAKVWNQFSTADWTLRAKTPLPSTWPWPPDYIEGHPQITRMGLKRDRKLGVRAYDVIDTHLYCRASRDIVTLDQIVEWYGGLRRLMWERGLEVKPTMGGLARQLLEHHLEPNTPALVDQGWRHYLGKATQDTAREALAPALTGHGSAVMGQNYPQAWYLDQDHSWPSCALGLMVPVNPLPIDLPATHERDAVTQRLSIPGVHRVAFRNEPSEYRWVSSEHHALDMVAYWAGGIGGKKTWPILNGLGEAMLDLRQTADPYLRETLKTLTVATFGLLGTEARPTTSTSYGGGKGGQSKYYLCWGEGISLRTSLRTFSAKGNSIALAMLRDRMHSRTWDLADKLAAFGLDVLALYDDGLIVAGGQLMPIPSGWSLKHALRDLIFFDTTNWVASGRESRLPNYPPGEDRAEIYRQYDLLVESKGEPFALPLNRPY